MLLMGEIARMDRADAYDPESLYDDIGLAAARCKVVGSNPIFSTFFTYHS